METAVTRRKDVEGLEIDPDAFTACYFGCRIELTYTEFRILYALMSKPDQLVPSDRLVREAWDEGHVEQDDLERRLYSHISRLRRKLPREWGYQVQRLRKRGYILSREYRAQVAQTP